MTRVFAYCRVSTSGQTTDNQIQEIAAAGFHVMPVRAITETISGSVAAIERPGFRKLQEKLEAGDVLIVTKLDGTAKGGVVIGISDQLKVPVKYIGLGESMEALQLFNKRIITLFH